MNFIYKTINLILPKLVEKTIFIKKNVFFVCLVPFEKRNTIFFTNFCQNRKGGPLRFFTKKLQKIQISNKGWVLQFFFKCQKGRGDIYKGGGTSGVNYPDTHKKVNT